MENKKRVNLYLDNNLLVKAKTQAAIEDTTLTNIIEKALKAYLPSKITINGKVKTEK